MIHHRYAALSVLFVSLTAACGVTVPASDGTPPDLTFYVRVNDATWSEVPSGGMEVSMGEDDVVKFWALAEDSGGVKSVEISGGGSMQCASGSTIDVHDDLDYSAASAEDSSVGVGGSALGSRSALLQVSSVCEGSFELRTVNVTIGSSAENFHGGVTTSGSVRIKKG